MMGATLQQRFVTLDVFRGMTVFLMIIVNTQGSGAEPYHQLMHAEWNGFTVTDLVFPSFLFAVGNAMPFAMRKWEGLRDSQVIYTILKRSVLIFLVGYLLSWYSTMHWTDGQLQFAPILHTRIMAVLQRIALCYLSAALLTHYFSNRTVVILSIVILLGYWVLLFGYGPMTIENNLVRKIDLAVIGEQHMYRERGIIFDPEGLLSTLPAITNVTAGYLCGRFIQKQGKTASVVVRLLWAGGVFILIAAAWNLLLPFNKKLWTSSYVTLTIGIDVLSVGLLFYIVEIKNRSGIARFFSPMGKNPLFIYVLSNLLLFVLILPLTSNKIFIEWINAVLFQKVAPGPFGAFLFSLCFTLILWLVAFIMDKRKLYVRL